MTGTLRLRVRCDQRWADLALHPEGRHCARCDRVVVDLSRLTEPEARAAVSAGRCGRVRYDVEGAPIFRRAPTRRRLPALAIVGALAGACAPGDAPPDPLVSAPAPLAPPPPDTDPDAGLASPPAGLALDELPATELARIVQASAEAAGPAVPTAEQRALTAHKRRRAAGVAPSPLPVPPPAPYDMGLYEPW